MGTGYNRDSRTSRRLITEDSILFSLLKRQTKTKGLVGVSFSPEGIAISRVQREEGKTPLLDACAFTPLDEGSNTAVKLEQLVADNELSNSHCNCVMAPESHNLLLIEAPDVQPAELKAAVRWRIKDLIDFHIDDAVIDVFEIPEQDAAPGRARLMYAVAARASRIHRDVDNLEKSSLQLQVVDIPELALRNITSLLDDDVRGVALLYLDQDGGIITLTRQGSLYLSRNIDVGLRNMIPGAGDEELHPQTVQALDKIVLEVQRSLDYYESHFAQPPITSLVIAPMEQEIPGVLPYLSANLGMAASMLDVNNILEVAEPVPGTMQSRCLLAIGAALRHESKVL